MSKVKGRRKPLHSEITSLRRSKKATAVEAPAPESAAADSAAPEEASPESEVSTEGSTESAAEAGPSGTTEAVEESSAVEPEPEAASEDGLEPEGDTAIHATREHALDGFRTEALDMSSESFPSEDAEADRSRGDAFDPMEGQREASNVVSIDGDEPNDMEAFLCGLIEALLFTSQKPLPLKDLARSAGIDRPRARELLERLMRSYAPRGINIDEVAGGYVLRSSPRYAPQIQKFLSLRPVRLSRAQLETLAIIAYRQPVTKPEVDDIRGVDSGQVLKGLLERDLLKTLGKKDEPGRPMLYGTTNDFLELLNLRSLGELPTLREYTELSDESKLKFAEETGEEAPNELPLVDPAEAASAASAGDAPAPLEDRPSPEAEPAAEAPSAGADADAEVAVSASADEHDSGQDGLNSMEGAAEELLDGPARADEGDASEPAPTHGDIESARADEDEEDPAQQDDEDEEEEDDEDEDDFDDDEDEDDFDDDDADDEDEDADDEDEDEDG